MLESMLFRIDSIRDPVKKHMKNISREFQVNRFAVKGINNKEVNFFVLLIG